MYRLYYLLYLRNDPLFLSFSLIFFLSVLFFSRISSPFLSLRFLSLSLLHCSCFITLLSSLNLKETKKSPAIDRTVDWRNQWYNERSAGYRLSSNSGEVMTSILTLAVPRCTARRRATYISPFSSCTSFRLFLLAWSDWTLDWPAHACPSVNYIYYFIHTVERERLLVHKPCPFTRNKRPRTHTRLFAKGEMWLFDHFFFGKTNFTKRIFVLPQRSLWLSGNTYPFLINYIFLHIILIYSARYLLIIDIHNRLNNRFFY